MKIALLTPTFLFYSGIDRLVEGNAQELMKKGHEVMIMTLHAEMKSNANVVELGMPKDATLQRIFRLFFYDRGKIIQAAKMLKGYDKVVSYFYPMNLIAKEAKKRYGCHYQYYNAGVTWPYLFSNPFERAYMWLFTKFTNRSVKGCDSAVSISEFLRGVLKRETGVDSEVRYIPVDKKRFNRKVRDKEIRYRLLLGKDPVLLYVGRISPHKGIHDLIGAYKIAKKRIPNLWLVLVGKHTFPEYSKRLKAMADKQVLFEDFVPDRLLPEYYAASTLYVTASYWEGYDIPVVEAQSCGKRVVAYDAGSHPEVVKEGTLVKTGDVNGFAAAIVEEVGGTFKKRS
ncbi:MAG: glycosyltransferase family 4 protein [Nanoarchaeota archaeon]